MDDLDALPDLAASLTRRGLLSNAEPPPPTGPRRWWGGPLDVEGLALASVSLAARAVDEVVGEPGSVGAWSADARFTEVRCSDVAAAFDSLGHLRVDGVRPQGFADLSGFFATSDGWIRTHGNYPHHAARLGSALGAETKDAVSQALLDLTAADAEQRITDAGGIAAAVGTRDAWVGAATVPVATPATWIDIDIDPADAPAGLISRALWTPSRGAVRPLTGLRVLDLTRVIAGPTATRVLAALGADVLRIDPPATPELVDQHIDTGFGKRSAVADLDDADAAAAVQGLLDAADVIVTGYRNGGLDRFGLEPSILRVTHPHLIVVSLDAWGDTGPRAHRRGFDSIVQAATGISAVYADRTGRPGALPVQALDHATGYGVVAAAVALALARSRDGRVGHAHLSLARSADILFGSAIPTAAVENIDDPDIRSCRCDYGHVDFVLPPLRLAGSQITYPHPPHLYGSDQLEWLPRR